MTHRPSVTSLHRGGGPERPASQKNLTLGFSELGDAVGGLPKRTSGEVVPGQGAPKGGGGGGDEERQGPEVGPHPFAKPGLSSTPRGSPFPTHLLPELTGGPQLVQHNVQGTFSAPALTLRHQMAVPFTVRPESPAPPRCPHPAVSEGLGREKTEERE